MRAALPWLAAFAAVVAAGALVAVAATRSSNAGGAENAAVSGSATFAPRVVLFGDSAKAEVAVSVDPRRVDPRTLRVHASFAPFTQVAPPRVTTDRDGGGADVVRFDYRLQCLVAACSRPGGQRPVALPPARVTWAGAGSALLPWPEVAVASRLTAADLRRPAFRYSSAAPAAGYRVRPSLFGWAAVGAAAAIVLALGGVGTVGLRRLRRPAPAPRSSALERALLHVERAANGTHAARRAAIGELAGALEHGGFVELAPLARRLAWSSRAPSGRVAAELAVLVRAALEVAA